MNNKRDIYKALVAGKTITDGNDTVKLDKEGFLVAGQSPVRISRVFNNHELWEIKYES